MSKNIELNSQSGEPVIDPSKIKQQMAEMNQQAAQAAQQPVMTEEEMLKRQQEEEDRLDKALPYLRKQAEATRLEMELTRMDVLIGRANPSQIPGAFGKQLEVECMEAQLAWSNLKLDQQSMMRRALEEKKELEKAQQEDTAKAEVKK